MHTLYTQYLSIVLTRLLLSYILEYTHYILSISVTLYTQCLSIRDWLPKFSDCSCDWQMDKTHRAGSNISPAAHDRCSDDEGSESGDLSGTSSEKQRLFDTRAALREAQPESLRLAGEIADDDEADEHDADDDDDDTHAKEMGKKKAKKSRAGSRFTFIANSLMGRSVSGVPGRRIRQPMSVRLLLLLPRPSFVMRFESTTQLSMT